MGSFGDLLYDLSTALGSGMEKGMSEERTETANRKKLKLQQEFDIEREQRGYAHEALKTHDAALKERLEREAGWRTLAPYLEPDMPPVTSAEVAPQARPEILRERPVMGTRPGKVDPGAPLSVAGNLASLIKAKQPKPPTDRGHQPYDDAYRRVLAATGDQTKAERAGREAAAAASGLKVGAGIGATQGAPPTATPAERKDILDTETVINQVNRTKEKFKREYVGILQGGVRGKFGARIGGGDPEELAFRASAAVLRRDLRMKFSGLAVTNPELWMNIEAIPDPEKVAPDMFMATLDENLTVLQDKLGRMKAQFARPANQPATPAPKPKKVIKDYGDGFVLESD
jgi:hypothetical protein